MPPNNYCAAVFLLATAVVSATNLHHDLDLTWGAGRARIARNGQVLTLTLDRISGSGFQSKRKYVFVKIGMQLKLVPGNSAGTVTTFYLSSDGWDTHDEIDFEFLGNLSGEPYTVQTNVYTQGRGGREQQFRLWFDPTIHFHTYSIVWNPTAILFFVDDTLIRVFRNLESKGVPYPKSQPMRLYSSIWNADDWATHGGLIKTDWTWAPFTASYRNLYAAASDESVTVSLEMDPDNQRKLMWVQRNCMIYNYCMDAKRFTRGFPLECNYPN